MNSLMKYTAMATAFALLAAPAAAVTINFDNLAEGTVLSNQYAGVTFVANAFIGAGSSSSGAAWATNTGMRVTATDLGGLGSPSLVSGKLLHAFGNTYTDGDWLDENGDPSFFMNFASAINSISVTFAGVATPADTRIFVYNGTTLLATVAGTVTTGQFALSYSARRSRGLRSRPVRSTTGSAWTTSSTSPQQPVRCRSRHPGR